jgi:hypothetical protein
MSALTDALAALKQVHDNEQALADPVGMTYSAQMAFYDALVAAVEGNSTQASPVVEQNVSSSTASVEQSSPALTALQEENAALKAQVEAGANAVAAFEAALHPATTEAAPASTEPPAIAPTNAGV